MSPNIRGNENNPIFLEFFSSSFLEERYSKGRMEKSLQHSYCGPLTSSRIDWQSYLQYPFILWDPLAQFPYVFNTQSFLCPTCLEDTDKTDIKSNSFLSRTNHWFNGRLKRYNPQLLYHTNSCILLVSCMYRCCKGHKVSSCHPSILLSFPSSDRFEIPFCLFHKSGFTKDALHLVQKLVDEGLGFEQIERLLELQYRDAFSIMELKLIFGKITY